MDCYREDGASVLGISPSMGLLAVRGGTDCESEADLAADAGAFVFGDYEAAAEGLPDTSTVKTPANSTQSVVGD